jgi:hypothetical protein
MAKCRRAGCLSISHVSKLQQELSWLSSRSALKKVSRNGRYLERRANTTNGEQIPQNPTARDRSKRGTCRCPHFSPYRETSVRDHSTGAPHCLIMILDSPTRSPISS